MGTPTSQHKQRRSPMRYTGYMALMIELIEIKISSLDEAVSQHVWIDAMVEEYESIMKNNVWEVLSIPKGK